MRQRQEIQEVPRGRRLRSRARSKRYPGGGEKHRLLRARLLKKLIRNFAFPKIGRAGKGCPLNALVVESRLLRPARGRLADSLLADSRAREIPHGLAREAVGARSPARGESALPVVSRRQRRRGSATGARAERPAIASAGGRIRDLDDDSH